MLNLHQDYLEQDAGRRRKVRKESAVDDEELDEEEQTSTKNVEETKKMSKKKAREAAKEWSEKRNNFDETKVDSFIRKHAKEVKRYIEAIYI